MIPQFVTRHNSLHHPIHALTIVVWVLVSGLGLGYVLVFLGLFLEIHPGSDSVIQSFSEYHDSSCARVNALQNSRMERGRHARGGMKRSSMGSLCKVRLSAWKKRSFSQQESGKVHEEAWTGLLQKQGLRISEEVEIVPGVLSRWRVLHVLITLLCHLGQAELFGTCWAGQSWRTQLGLGVPCSAANCL